MSKVYDKKFLDKLSNLKDLQVLKPLLWDIQKQEPEAIKEIQELGKTDLGIDFKESFICFSNYQVYKAYSTYGIMKFFNRNIKFLVLDFSMILDIWYDSKRLGVIDKNSLFTNDILIIKGVVDGSFAENRQQALFDLINIRKTMQKNTWFFIKGYKGDFERYYSKVVNLIENIYTLN